MADTRKKLYGRAVKLDKFIKAAPGICKAIFVLVLGGLAGEEHCRGREFLAYALLGFGLLISMGALCRRNGAAKH